MKLANLYRSRSDRCRSAVSRISSSSSVGSRPGAIRCKGPWSPAANPRGVAFKGSEHRDWLRDDPRHRLAAPPQERPRTPAQTLRPVEQAGIIRVIGGLFGRHQSLPRG